MVNFMGISLLSFGIIKIFKGFYISVFSIITFAVFLSYDEPIYILILLFSALLHELGHIIPLLIFKAKIKRITLFPFGIDIVADTLRLSYKKEFFCTVGGGVCNLFAALAALIVMRFVPSAPLLFFMLSNLALGVFNLIPLPFLDGGKAIWLAIYDMLDITLADDIIKSINIVSLFVFSSLAFILVARAGFNLSVVFIVVYGTISMLGKRKKMSA